MNIPQINKENFRKTLKSPNVAGVGIRKKGKGNFLVIYLSKDSENVRNAIGEVVRNLRGGERIKVKFGGYR